MYVWKSFLVSYVWKSFLVSYVCMEVLPSLICMEVLPSLICMEVLPFRTWIMKKSVQNYGYYFSIGNSWQTNKWTTEMARQSVWARSWTQTHPVFSTTACAGRLFKVIYGFVGVKKTSQRFTSVTSIKTRWGVIAWKDIGIYWSQFRTQIGVT